MKYKYIVDNFLLYLVIVHYFSACFFSDATTGIVGDFIELIDPRELIESTDYCTIWSISGLASFLGHNNSTIKASFCYSRCFLALQGGAGRKISFSILSPIFIMCTDMVRTCLPVC